MKISFCTILLVLLTASVAFGQTAPQPKTDLRFNVKNMDTSVDPCTNFYLYACGGWMKANPVPSDQTRWGRFNQLAEDNLAVLQTILEEAAKPNPKRSAVQQKIGDLYASCMDEAQVNKLGAKPLQPLFDQIAAIKSQKDLIKVVAQLHNSAIPGLFSMFPQPDMHDANKEIVFVDQGGMTFPDRDYYIKDDAKSKDRARNMSPTYRRCSNFWATNRKSPGYASPDHGYRDQPRQSLHGSRRTSQSQESRPCHDQAGIGGAGSELRFHRHFELRGVPKFENLNTVNPEFFKQINPQIASVPLEDWKTYLRWKALNDAASCFQKPS